MPHKDVVLISGCSSGIGRALAERLSSTGARVYAGMHDATRDYGLRNVRPLPLDVTSPEQILAAIARIERETGTLDVLVANAGIGAIGPWEIVPPEVVRKVFDVNFFGTVALAKAVLPLMRRQRHGHIALISSLSGHVALPMDGVYSASKFALDAFGESLSYEVRRWNIRVSILSPGRYASGLDTKAWRPRGDGCGEYAPWLRGLESKSGNTGGTAQEAADRIIAAMNDSSGRLRYPLDDTGRWVFRALHLEQESDREAVIEAASGLAWWLDADATPPDQ